MGRGQPAASPLGGLGSAVSSPAGLGRSPGRWRVFLYYVLLDYLAPCVDLPELDQLLFKCISNYYKIQITFFKVIQILFSITLAMTGKIQNTFLESN